MGASHLEASRPCRDYGKKCWKCKLRTWCLLFREKPPEKEGKKHGKE